MSDGPLFGARIVVTRAADRAGALTTQLSAAGAAVVEMPATRIERLESTDLDRAVAHLSDYDWLIFTSRTAVELFWQVLPESIRTKGGVPNVRVAAVGSSTAAALSERGVVVDLVPSRFVAEGLVDAMRQRNDVRGARMLYPTAEGARDVLQRGLGEMDARVDRIPIYRSVPAGTGAADVRRLLERDEIDLVTFTSTSTVQGFVSSVGVDAARRAPAATIGPVTSQAARDAGLDVAVEAHESTMAGLVKAVIEFVTSRPRPE